MIVDRSGYGEGLGWRKGQRWTWVETDKCVRTGRIGLPRETGKGLDSACGCCGEVGREFLNRQVGSRNQPEDFRLSALFPLGGSFNRFFGGRKGRG